MLNRLRQYLTVIDGMAIHFLQIRSRHSGTMSRLLTQGWPGSVIEFHKVLAPLTDPTAHGGRAEDAFHVVIRSFPGLGFLGKPAGTG